jgi:hypothetical protein
VGTTKNSSKVRLLDLSRTVARAGRVPSGIDRVERAYLRELLSIGLPFYGLIRTRLGYLLLDMRGAASLLSAVDSGASQEECISCARARSAFCSYILAVGPGTFGEIRDSLRKHFAVPLPKGAPDDTYDAAAHRAAFLAFLKFLKANLGGQTGIRVDPSWATQSALIQGFAGFGSPVVILRRGRVAEGLGFLAGEVGLDLEPFSEAAVPEEARLRSIYDDEIEAAARAAYQRDYVGFGFGDWDGQAA